MPVKIWKNALNVLTDSLENVRLETKMIEHVFQLLEMK
jgi:hypothetical protein